MSRDRFLKIIVHFDLHTGRRCWRVMETSWLGIICALSYCPAYIAEEEKCICYGPCEGNDPSNPERRCIDFEESWDDEVVCLCQYHGKTSPCASIQKKAPFFPFYFVEKNYVHNHSEDKALCVCESVYICKSCMRNIELLQIALTRKRRADYIWYAKSDLPVFYSYADVCHYVNVINHRKLEDKFSNIEVSWSHNDIDEAEFLDRWVKSGESIEAVPVNWDKIESIDEKYLDVDGKLLCDKDILRKYCSK